MSDCKKGEEKGRSHRRSDRGRRVRKVGLTKSDTVSQSLSSCPGPWTVHCTEQTVHSIVESVRYTLYSIACTGAVACTLYSSSTCAAHCTVPKHCTEHCTVPAHCTAHCTVPAPVQHTVQFHNSVQDTVKFQHLYSTLYSSNTLYSTLYISNTLYCTLFSSSTLYSTLYSSSTCNAPVGRDGSLWAARKAGERMADLWKQNSKTAKQQNSVL